MDPEIREAILGHQFKQRSVSERYGRISDEELLNAIDNMSFDHGPTEILVSRNREEPKRKREHFVNKMVNKEKGHAVT